MEKIFLNYNRMQCLILSFMMFIFISSCSSPEDENNVTSQNNINNEQKKAEGRKQIDYEGLFATSVLDNQLINFDINSDENSILDFKDSTEISCNDYEKIQIVSIAV